MITLLFSILIEARAVDLNRRQALGLLGGAVAATKVRASALNLGSPTSQLAGTTARAGWATSRLFRKYLIIDHLKLSHWDDFPKWREANLIDGTDPSGTGRTVRFFVSPVDEKTILERAEQMEALEDDLSSASGLAKGQLWARIDSRAAFVDFCEPVPHAKVSDAYLEEVARRVRQISPSLGQSLDTQFAKAYPWSKDETEQFWRGRVWSCFTTEDMIKVRKIENGVAEDLGRPKRQVWEESSYLLRPDHELPWSLNHRPRFQPADTTVRSELLMRMQAVMPETAERVKADLVKIERDAHARYFFDPDFISREGLEALERDAHERFPVGNDRGHRRHGEIIRAKARLERFRPAGAPHVLVRALEVALKDDKTVEADVETPTTPESSPAETLALLGRATDCSLDLSGSLAPGASELAPARKLDE